MCEKRRADRRAGVAEWIAVAQYLSVMPTQPPVGLCPVDLLVVDDVGVLLRHEVVRAEHAERAFVLDEEVLHVRRALAHDARIGVERDRHAGLVLAPTA